MLSSVGVFASENFSNRYVLGNSGKQGEPEN